MGWKIVRNAEKLCSPIALHCHSLILQGLLRLRRRQSLGTKARGERGTHAYEGFARALWWYQGARGRSATLTLRLRNCSPLTEAGGGQFCACARAGGVKPKR